MILAGAALLSACSSANDARGNDPTDGREAVSFNDGTQSDCVTIEIAPYAKRADVADALAQGAADIEQRGCVIFVFIE
jgi:hypothetical protein